MQEITNTENMGLVTQVRMRLVNSFLKSHPDIKFDNLESEETYKAILELKKKEEAEEAKVQWEKDKVEKKEKKLADYKVWVEENVPTRYRTASAKDFANVAEVSSLFCLNTSALIIGMNATGKTHLAWAIAKTARWFDKSVLVVNAFKLFSEIKATAGSWYTAIESYKKYDVLIIDEYDKCYGSDSDYILLSEIVDARYDDMKTTIVIGNGDANTACKILGQSVVSRLTSDGGKLILLNGENKRLKKS